MSKQNFFAVNWIDGMKITRSHFIESAEHHFSQSARVAQAVGRAYGLFATDGKSLELQVLVDSLGTLQIHVSRCSGITPAGFFVQSEEGGEVSFETSIGRIQEMYPGKGAGERAFYIVLSVDYFDRKPWGEPRFNEEPPRHPYTVPTYTLTIIPVDSVNPAVWGGGGLVIGKLFSTTGGFRRSHEYIPPVVSPRCYLPLTELVHALEGKYSEMESACVKIIHKIKTKSQKSTIADSVQLLTETLVMRSSRQMREFRFQALDYTMQELLVLLLEPAFDIRSVLMRLTDKEREETIAYFGEWTDEKPGNIERQISTLTQISFNPLEFAESIALIRDFIDFWNALFHKLSQLEFIGKRRGQQVFIVESPVHETPPVVEKPKSRWSPI